ncbi:hypothetical protein [Neobacillus cucumis]|uniref:hypothetical protein n=1 Tax=Neobacillus cucumis TaxID=1740721 RepID=UPI001966C4D4|nr:hypothetical protein [Neobacillus cucumis]MBM7652998.1 TolA-binding protein [Neobacillus cucumis]
MKKRKWFLLVVGFALLSGCSQNVSSETKKVEAASNNQLEKKNQEIKKLNQRVQGLEKKVESLDEENKNLPILLNLSRQFVTAKHEGNKEQIRTLLSDELSLTEMEDGVYVVTSQGKFPLHTKKTEDGFVGWDVSNYSFDHKKNEALIQITEMYQDKNGEEVSPTTFLYLKFKKVDGDWTIFDIWYDV